MHLLHNSKRIRSKCFIFEANEFFEKFQHKNKTKTNERKEEKGTGINGNTVV